MFSRRSSPKITSDYIAKIKSSIIIIQTAIINDSPAYDFIYSISNRYTLRQLNIIKYADLNITIPQNQTEIDNVLEIAAAIVEITTLVQLLSTFYDYKLGSKLTGDITFNNVNVSIITRIVPILLTNKQAIIGNLLEAYQSNNDDIEFYDTYIDINKVINEYTSRSNPMATGLKTTKNRRHKRGSKRGSKRSSKHGSKRSSKHGSKRGYKRGYKQSAKRRQ
jgi:hypothetical protein